MRLWRNWQTRYFEGVVISGRVGSSPTNRTTYRGMAQFGRAPGLGPGGRRFESCCSDHQKNKGCRIWCISSKRQPIFVHTYILRQERGLAGLRSYLLYKKGLPTNLLVRQPLFIYFRSALALSSKISFTSFSFRPLSRIASTEAFWLTQGLSLPKSILSAPWCRTKQQNFSLDKCSILLPEW